jgi:hypothetical protein
MLKTMAMIAGVVHWLAVLGKMGVGEFVVVCWGRWRFLLITNLPYINLDPFIFLLQLHFLDHNHN